MQQENLTLNKSNPIRSNNKSKQKKEKQTSKFYSLFLEMPVIFAKTLRFKHSNYYVLVVSMILVAYIIAECFFRASFEEYSDQIAIHDQKSYKQSWFKWLSFMTNLGYGLPLSIIVLYYYEISKNKINAIFLVLLTTYLNYFLSIIKMLYHQPRPYMRNPDILPLFKCGPEWGNPSGHAMCGLAFYFIVFNSLRKRLLELNFLEDFSKAKDLSVSPQNKGPQDFEMKEIINPKSKESLPNECDHKDRVCTQCKKNIVKRKVDEEVSLCEPCIQTGQRDSIGKDSVKNDPPSHSLKVKRFHFFANIFCYSVSLSLIAFIGYSRFFFGLHSLNQILLGWIYGFFYIVLFYYVLTSKEIMIDRVLIFFERISKFNKRNLRILYIFYVTVLMILSFLIPWIIYYVMNSDYEISQDYIDNIIIKCPVNYATTQLLFYDNCFSDVGTISINFGILYGILFSSGNYAHEDFWPNYWNLPHWKKALRMSILAALAGIIFGVWSAINFKQNAYIVCFLNNGLKGLLLGFLVITLLPKVYLKLKLDVKGDFMREKED